MHICILQFVSTESYEIETQARLNNKVLLCAGPKQLSFNFSLLSFVNEQETVAAFNSKRTTGPNV